MSGTAPAANLGIAFVGCGYVADFYAATLPNHPQLRLVTAFDIDQARLRSFCEMYGVRAARDEYAVLHDPNVDLVVNLTPPSQHDEVNLRVIAAGKHLYCEKPLATRPEAAQKLVDLARTRGLVIGAAPCSILGEPAQTLWENLRAGLIGTPRLVYAELDNGPLPYLGSDQWLSARGVPWPTLDEVATGCTLEHAAYYVTWLVAMFGPVAQVDATVMSVLRHEWPAEIDVAPDLSISVLRHVSGVACRLTCGWVAPADLSMTVVGDQGVLRVENAWSYSSPVAVRRRQRPTGKNHDYLAPSELVNPVRSQWPERQAGYLDSHDMDLSRGIAEVAEKIMGRGELTLSPEAHAHVVDVCLRLAAGRSGRVPVLDAWDTSTVVHGPQPLRASISSIRSR